MQDISDLPALQCYLLGAPRVIWQGQTWSIARKQVRALLYCLALRPRPVSRDQLAFLFWADIPNAEAHRQLTRLLTHLRRALPDPGLMVIEGDGVRLDSTRVATDTTRFEAASSTAGIETLEAALQMCRGPFLEGFSLPGSPEFDLWAENERRCYARSYIELASNLVERCMRLGLLERAIAHARRVLECDDLAETMHRRLIELFGLIGDRHAAQRQYEQCAATLLRELGVAPLPETQLAYQAAMSGGVDRPLPPPAALHPDLPLIGREIPMQALRNAYQQTLNGQGRLALITGEAGIGKTRLAEAFLAELTGYPAEKINLLTLPVMRPNQGLALHLAAEILRQAIRQCNLIAKIEPVWLAEAARLLPELHRLAGSLPPIPPPEPAEARTRLFEALIQCVATLADEPLPLVIFCDDLHWADRESVEWLACLAERLRQRRVLLLATAQDSGAEGGGAQGGDRNLLRTLIDTCERGGRLLEISLTGLRAADLERVVAAIPAMRQANPALVAHIQRVTGGNPFFLRETLNLLREQTQFDPTQPDVASIPLPESIRAVVRQRLEPLTPQARQVLEALAVLNRPASFDESCQLAGRDEAETCEALDVLAARKLVVEQQGDFSFRHACIRDVVYEDLSPWRRSLLQRRVEESIGRRQA